MPLRAASAVRQEQLSELLFVIAVQACVAETVSFNKANLTRVCTRSSLFAGSHRVQGTLSTQHNILYRRLCFGRVQ